MKKMLSGGMLAGALVATVLSGCGKEENGQTCDGNQDCISDYCLNGVCDEEPFNKALYEPCTASDDCAEHVCAGGYCTKACGMYGFTGAHAVGDCLNVADDNTCVNAEGIGCCKITSVVPESNTDHLLGQCTPTP